MTATRSPTLARAEASTQECETPAMTHLRCLACHLRVPRTWGLADAFCPDCDAPLEWCNSRDVVGYWLWAPPGPSWATAALDAVAQAVAQVVPPTPSRSP
jgi:hypothetical protein